MTVPLALTDPAGDFVYARTATHRNDRVHLMATDGATRDTVELLLEPDTAEALRDWLTTWLEA